MSEVKEENKLHTKRYWVILAVVIAVLVGGFFIFDAMKYQSTDDAYVETTTVSVSPKVSGQIVKVLVKDNQPVKAGDVVAVIDKIDYQVRLEQATAAYERALLNQQNAHANLNAANSEIELAQKDVERYQNLYKAGAVSKQTLDKAITHLEAVSAKQTTAEQAIFSKDPSKAAKVADADLNVLKAQKRAAELAYEYTDIVASIDGTISNKKVEVGMLVQPGSPLCVIVPNDVWVVANFKETQLTNMSGVGYQAMTQKERGYYFQNFVLNMLESKVFVGWQWFRYTDNLADDRENTFADYNANKGVYTRDYKPWTELLGQMKMINRNIYGLCDYFDR